MDGSRYNHKTLMRIPGFRPERLMRLMRPAIQRCDLNLTDLVIFIGDRKLNESMDLACLPSMPLQV